MFRRITVANGQRYAHPRIKNKILTRRGCCPCPLGSFFQQQKQQGKNFICGKLYSWKTMFRSPGLFQIKKKLSKLIYHYKSMQFSSLRLFALHSKTSQFSFQKIPMTDKRRDHSKLFRESFFQKKETKRPTNISPHSLISVTISSHVSGLSLCLPRGLVLQRVGPIDIIKDSNVYHMRASLLLQLPF